MGRVKGSGTFASSVLVLKCLGEGGRVLGC